MQLGPVLGPAVGNTIGTCLAGLLTVACHCMGLGSDWDNVCAAVVRLADILSGWITRNELPFLPQVLHATYNANYVAGAAAAAAAAVSPHFCPFCCSFWIFERY